jgi:sec-independent protein translocase protein TatA
MAPTLLFLDISFGEIFIIVAVIFIIFGPQKIPEIARKVGKGIREVKKASSDIQREIKQEVNQYKTDLDLERIVNDNDNTKKKDADEVAEEPRPELKKGTE